MTARVARLPNGHIDPSDPGLQPIRQAQRMIRVMAPDSDNRIAAETRLVVELGRRGLWEAWTAALAPGYLSGPDTFSDYQRQFWNWLMTVGPERPRPFVACWPRGGGKTSSVQLALLMIACLRLRGYAIYVGQSQSAVEDKVSAVGELLMSPAVARSYPSASQIYETSTGAKRDWRRSRIRTKSGFTLDAFGMDQALRGVKVDELRPGCIVLDDIEEYHDTPYMTQKRIDVLTRTIIPAAAPNAIIIYIQNKIHDDSIMAQLLDGRADFLGDRQTVGPIPQIENMVTEPYEFEDRVCHRIVSGTPTWSSELGIETSNNQLREEGLVAFLSEKQHETDVEEGTKFPRDMWRFFDAEPRGLRLVRAWDLAATEGGGDYTVGILMGMADNGDTYVLDVVRGQWNDDKVERIVVDTSEADQEKYGRVPVRIEAQPGAAGKAWNRRWTKDLLLGLPIRMVPAQGSKDFRADGWASCQQGGQGHVRETEEWASVLIREHAQFPDHGRHDDIVDACALGYNELAAGKRSKAKIRSSGDRRI